MKTLSSFALAGALALGLATAAQAQTYDALPQIPTPANPNPLNPVATNGTPLPSRFDGGLLSGRSAYVAGPAGIVGAGLGTAGAIVGTGVGVAGTAVDTGVGTAGTVVDGVVPR